MNHKLSLVVIAVCFAIITCTANLCLAVQTADFRIVTTEAPFFNTITFSAPLINEAGQTAFLQSREIVFSEGSGSLEQIAVAPNLGLGNSGSIANLRFNSSGQTAFSATGSNLSGGQVTVSEGVFIQRPGEAVQLVVQRDDQAPGANGDDTFLNFRNIGLSDSGQITLDTILNSPISSISSDSGIFSFNDGALTSVVQSGDPSPPANAGTFFRDVSILRQSGIRPVNHAVNASGEIAFVGDIQPSIDGVSQGIFSAGPEGVAPIVLRGDQVSNAAEGVVINSFDSSPVINNAGEIVFRGTVISPDLEQPALSILSVRSDGLEQIAVEGAQAPGVEQGVVFNLTGFDPFASPPEVAFNDSGQTAFGAALAGDNLDQTNSFAIFSDVAGDLQPVARSGDQVTGAEDGLRFAGFGSSVELNELGQIAFFAGLTTDGESFSTGIFVADADGQLTEIVRTGDVIDASDDPLTEDLRTVALLRFGAEDDTGGLTSSFNNSGQLAFYAFFADGSEAIIVSSRAVARPVPLGDCNQDGVVNFLDIAPFIAILSSGGFRVEADINEDGIVNFLDISPFVVILSR